MKITHIETIPYKIPYLTPLEFATGIITDVENVLVRIHTDQGVIGQSEAPARPYIYGESLASIVTAIHHWFIPSLEGIDIEDNEKVYHALRWVIGNQTARAAIDLAIYDAIGKNHGVSCRQLLGGMTNRIKVSHMIGYDLPERMAEQAIIMKQKYGINTFKVKTGKNVQIDIQVCRTIRKALPESVLYLDANHGWTAQETLYAADMLRDLNFSFFEEPCPASDRMGRHKVNQFLPLPVCGDESCTTLDEVGREILDGTASMVCIKTARTGFTESRKIAALCEGVSVPVYVGNQGDTKIGTLASIQFSAAFKYTSIYAAELTNFLEISDNICSTEIIFKDGEVIASDAAGLGIEIDEEKLSYYRLDSLPLL